jgi:trimethylamine:corrinoid methyltransferase-like protein
MKTARFEVLSQAEVERIHAASMEILAEVGIKVNYKKARELFREAGADVDEETLAVRLPEKLVRWAVDQAPKQFSLFGIDAEFRLDIGPDQACPSSPGWGRPRASSICIRRSPFDPAKGHARSHHPDRRLPATSTTRRWTSGRTTSP